MRFVDALSSAVGGRPAVPYTHSNAAPSILSGYGGARSTLLNAMGTNGTLYATVSRYASATSLVDWKLWRKSTSGKDEDRVEVTRHLALDVWNAPNPFAHRQLFVESTQQHLDLVGEGWWVIQRNEMNWPESMWLVRPDKIAPVPSSTKGIAGYVYHAPDGEQIPLETQDVIPLKMPNPADPGPAGRGLGAAQTILSHVEAAASAAQWNRNFFINSAVPGGIITVPNELGDTAFKRLRLQWRENHQGTSAAHRVGILEGGAKFDPGASHKDMEFSELLNVSRDVIREAFAMPKFMLGLVDDVNRATADASDAAFGAWGLVPRLERLKLALNSRFLPMFLPPGQVDVEFDYETPVPADAEAENKDLTARVTAYVALVRAGVNPEDAAATTGLPIMRVDQKQQAPSALPREETANA